MSRSTQNDVSRGAISRVMRDGSRPSQSETVRYHSGDPQPSLDLIAAHHGWLLDRGDTARATGARMKWLGVGIAFSARPAGNRRQASIKVDVLHRMLRSPLIHLAVRDAQVNSIAMMVAAAVAEAKRWRTPNVDGCLSHEDDAVEAKEPSSSDCAQYDVSAEERTFSQAERRVRAVERDDLASRQAGAKQHPEFKERQRHAVLHAVSMPVCSIRQLEAKQDLLCRRAHVSEPAWLLDGMIGGALLQDYETLELSAAQEDLMRAMLPPKQR